MTHGRTPTQAALIGRGNTRGDKDRGPHHLRTEFPFEGIGVGVRKIGPLMNPALHTAVRVPPRRRRRHKGKDAPEDAHLSLLDLEHCTDIAERRDDLFGQIFCRSGLADLLDGIVIEWVAHAITAQDVDITGFNHSR